MAHTMPYFILALVLGFIGLFGTVAVTAMPMWRVSAFIGANLIVMEELWEGLWMNCWRQANIKMQCKVYDSLLILPVELQAARGLMCVSIVLVVISLFSKNITLALGGSLYLLSFLTTLIPVSWVGHTVISKFYNPQVMDAEKRELGKALFLGWATSGVLLITGIITLLSYSKRRSKEEEHYTNVHLMSDGRYTERGQHLPEEDSIQLSQMNSKNSKKVCNDYLQHCFYV
uniref:Claudin n=1 Tax=Lates calcarifer TaxID=8187 RepID=A0A4W6E004_LATCA